MKGLPREAKLKGLYLIRGWPTTKAREISVCQPLLVPSVKICPRSTLRSSFGRSLVRNTKDNAIISRF